KQPVVACRKTPLFGEPAFSAGIRRVDADVHDLRHVQAPIPDRGKALLVPIRIGNDVDRHVDTQRAGELDGLEISTQGDALAELAQAVGVDRPKAQKDGFETGRLPELEGLLVAQKTVAARLEIDLLANASFRDRLTDGQAMLGLDEGDVVDDESPPFL